jgi:hypothetical protein
LPLVKLFHTSGFYSPLVLVNIGVRTLVFLFPIIRISIISSLFILVVSLYTVNRSSYYIEQVKILVYRILAYRNTKGL